MFVPLTLYYFVRAGIIHKALPMIAVLRLLGKISKKFLVYFKWNCIGCTIKTRFHQLQVPPDFLVQLTVKALSQCVKYMKMFIMRYQHDLDVTFLSH